MKPRLNLAAHGLDSVQRFRAVKLSARERWALQVIELWRMGVTALPPEPDGRRMNPYERR